MFIVFAGTASDNPIGAETSRGMFDSASGAKDYSEDELMQEYEVIQIAEMVRDQLLARWEWRQYGTGGNSGWVRVCNEL